MTLEVQTPTNDTGGTASGSSNGVTMMLEVEAPTMVPKVHMTQKWCRGTGTNDCAGSKGTGRRRWGTGSSGGNGCMLAPQMVKEVLEMVALMEDLAYWQQQWS